MKKQIQNLHRKVKNHFYVDDLNTAVYNTDEGFEFYKKMKVPFLEANFRKLESGERMTKILFELINLYKKNKSVNSGVEMDYVNNVNNEKVLGLYQDHEKDVISLKINEVFSIQSENKEGLNSIQTKRNIFSVIANVYDPVGYFQPLVIKLKGLFQKICKPKIEWDDDIGVLANKWKGIVASLNSNETISFDRYFRYNISDSLDKCQLYGFSDALTSAFAAVVHFKSISRCGNVVVKFVTSKSRIVPCSYTNSYKSRQLKFCRQSFWEMSCYQA